jgi:GntP family gluconate:H+ symporter
MSPVLIIIIGMIVVLVGILVIRLHPVLSLLIGALVVGLLTSPSLLLVYAAGKNLSPAQTAALLNQSLGERIAIGFGDTCAKIGLLIVLASITGKCLLDSGAAERIVRTLLKVSGEKKAPAALMISSFTLGIPIFVDTVYLLMIPLVRAMGVRNTRSYALYIMAMIAGGTITHSLVPPTPGPIFAARALNVSLGVMIIIGLIIGIVCSSVGLIYAYWLNKRQNIPFRETPGTSIDKLKEWSAKDNAQLPSFFMSLLPVLVPVILIAGETITASMKHTDKNIRSFFELAGDPTIAMFIGTAFALQLLLKQYSYRVKALTKPLEEAVYSAGTIILITASGGAFGYILQQTSIGSWLATHTADLKIAILPMAFIVTALIRTAQGSATVAMITAVGMFTAFNTPGALSFHPVYLAIVIGCGSKVFAWMNDSGFWVICKMSGFTEQETIKNNSVMLAIMGVVGLGMTMLMAKLFPFPFPF